jgi:hypothetical protein
MAIAEPSASTETAGGTHSTDVPGQGPKGDSDANGGSGASTGGSGKPDTGNGGNPANGNCGNDKSNGNAQHCGGGSSESSPPSVTPPSTTKTTTETTPSTKTTTSRTTTSRTTSSETTSSKTTSSETTSSETTTSTTTTPPGLPPPGGGGGGGAIAVPAVRPSLPPNMQLPATDPPVIDVVPGVGAAAAQLPIAPITLPVIVAPAAGLGAGGAPAEPAFPSLPVTPRGVTAEPLAGREPLPANAGSNVAVPANSYRVGYTEYLRNAGLSQVVALAVPGVTGMLVLTCAGGLVGYRQAKAGHAVHTSGTARFVN